MIRTAKLALVAAALSTTALSPLALAAPAPAQPAATASIAVPPIVYQQRVLANGMKVFTSRDTSTPNVSVQVWYGVGSKDDPQGRSGFAHLFEHLMFKATRNMPNETVDRLTEDVGGFNNASTWDDFTNYYEVVPANHLERLIWAEADRLKSLVIDEAVFASERDVVKEELRQRVLADPYGRFFALSIPQQSFAVHPYQRPGIGSIEELDAATVDDVRAFHRTYYRPDNAALIIVGNFDQAKLDAMIDKYFGSLTTPGGTIPKVTAVEPARTGPKTVNTYGPNVPLPALAITWLAPAAADKDTPALAVLDAILTAGKSSRLYDSLVYDQKIAQSVFSSAPNNAQPGLFYVGAIMAGGKTVAQGEAALRAQVARVRDGLVTPAELAEAKAGLLADAVRRREEIDGRGFAIGYALQTEGDAAAANTSLAKLQAVTAADIQRVARKHLADDRLTVINYLPEKDRPAGEKDATPPIPKVASVKYDGPITTLAPEAEREKPPAVAAPVPAVMPTPAEKTLANGLRVIVAKSSELPLITSTLTVKGGASSDPAGLAGTSSLTSELLTEGTATRSATQVARETEALGANLAAGSGWEAASLTLSVTANNADQAMAIMADVAQNPAFKAEELDRVRAETLDGLSVAFQRPGSLASFATSPVLYAGSAYGHVAGGTPGSLPKIKREDLAKTHAAYWRPDNAVLVVTGNLSPEAGFALAEKAFGGWKKPATPPPTPPAAPTGYQPRNVVIDLPGTGQAAVVLAKPAITRADPSYYQGVVANTVLGVGFSSRLNQEIRIKRGLSYGAGSSLTPQGQFGGFSARVQTKNPSAGEVISLTRAELSRLANEPASVGELAARKSVLVGGFGRDLGTSEGLAGILGNLAVYGVPLTEIQSYAAKVEAVTPQQVQAFAKTKLDPAQMSVIVAGDAKAMGEALTKVAPNATVIPAAKLDLDAPGLTQ
ncbi:insulinase family protein [Caulobacter vibrioides]|uniref:M16 family metallopeptidase n=1 Tax=Caulobacter vibrioides TaxID=155892 RepID=UPI000BB4C397|nr:pitrilysin family protein [Caulobacter vibrioides]ATC26439.1 insulinase family protein [Caulobacter vibrioides]AZH14568.1 insulinase family protein [Caulobacter vibrioides]PLR12260.1 insulinase family protein [Caulobacter vibrioides]